MLTLLLALAVCTGASAEPRWQTDQAQALSEAKAAGKPLLIEFQAPWCYSCYYMAANVLSKDAFSAAARGLVLLKEDVDKEEGGRLKAQYAVTALPTFILLSPKGEPLGRIVGEQTESDFLARLSSLSKPAQDPLEQAVDRLQQRLLTGELDSAARELSQLSAQRLAALRARRDWRILEARLGLYRARGQAAGAQLQTLLEEDDSCELPYEIERASATLLEAQAKALESLAGRRLFVPAPQRCADFRSGVDALAEVYGRLGRQDERRKLLRRAADFLADMKVPAGADRNHDDDRRFFLEALGDDAAVRAFYAELLAAYPADYVYGYRYGRYLLARGEAAEALKRAEAADRLAYGANRLAVTKLRAQALTALGRKPEAAALLRRDIKAGRAFPVMAKPLQELLSSLEKRP